MFGSYLMDVPEFISLEDYLQLVDWTGRAVRGDKRGAIPAHIQAIFQYITSSLLVSPMD